MSCPFCQNPTPPGKIYCSSHCARLVLSAVKEANPEVKNMSTFNRTPYTKPQYDKPTYAQPSYNKPSYQDLLKQNQESVAIDNVTNKCMTEMCQKQISGNELYCSDCDMNNTKCKKCGVNDRNMPHPICTDCHKTMKEKPHKEKKEKPSKYDKNKKPKGK